MDKPIFEVDDAIVLLLGAPSKLPQLAGRMQGVTRLEKLIFLLDQETSLRELMAYYGGKTFRLAPALHSYVHLADAGTGADALVVNEVADGQR